MLYFFVEIVAVLKLIYSYLFQIGKIVSNNSNNIIVTEIHADSVPNIAGTSAKQVTEFHADSVPDIAGTSTIQSSVCFDIEKIFENQKQILENQATISKQIDDHRQQQLDNTSAFMAQIQALINVQNGVIQKVSALSVQMENAVSQIVSSCNTDVLKLSDSKGGDENIPLHMKPVNNTQDLEFYYF